MSGDWRRLHRVRGVCSGSPENHWVTRLSHKTEAEDSTRRCGHPRPVQPPRRGGQTAWAGQIARASLTAQGGRSDRPGSWRRDASKRRTRVGAKQAAVAGHPSDEENLKTSKFALEGLYP
jgi:hypothetical protein